MREFLHNNFYFKRLQNTGSGPPIQFLALGLGLVDGVLWVGFPWSTCLLELLFGSVSEDCPNLCPCHWVGVLCHLFVREQNIRKTAVNRFVPVRFSLSQNK